MLLLGVLLWLQLWRFVVPFAPPVRWPSPAPPTRLGATTTTLAEELLSLKEDSQSLASLVEEKFEAIDQEVLVSLTKAEDAEAAHAAMATIKDATDARMSKAKARLETVLDAGELLEMDRRLTKLFKEGVVDAAFLVVLNANAAEAAKDATDEAAVQRARVFEHLYTRAQEEWEKRLPDQAKGVLHRLARTTDPAIRRNILVHYLAPKTEIVVPGKDPVPLDEPSPPLLASADLARAIADAVNAIRQLDMDGDMVRASIEDMRSLAKEARLVLLDSAPEADVRQFEQDLSATWPMH